jgi:hypothetical protein
VEGALEVGGTHAPPGVAGGEAISDAERRPERGVKSTRGTRHPSIIAAVNDAWVA